MDLALDDAALLALIRDDVPHGDLTTASLGIGVLPGRIEFFARGEMTLCASEEAARMFELAGATVDLLLPSGSALAAGAPFLRAQGSAASLHRVWKVAQTLCEYASGIASAAAGIVGALRAAGLAVPVACTRKNFPGTKALAIKAAHAGGAVMHRLGLSETLLLFAEHRAFIAEEELLPTLLRLKGANPEKKLVAEVVSLAEALRLAAYGVDVLQLEKFSPDEVGQCRDALAAAGWSPLLAAAGGVTVANAVAYVAAGADLLVTSAPYFARPADVKVLLVPLGA